VGNSLHTLSGTPHDHFTNEAEQLCGRLVAELRFAAIEEIMESGLPGYLDALSGKLNRIGLAIGQEYFR
jgi:uncharacterized alpha-E superfamily protein